MLNGYGRGRGSGRGMGLGFRGNSPPWPYVGRGRGGLPRCGYYFGGSVTPAPRFYQPQAFYPGTPSAPGNAPYSPGMTREEELNYMKDQSEAVKGQLEEIESRMHDLEAEKKSDK